MTISNSKTVQVDLFENKIAIIDKIRGEALALTCTFLTNRSIKFGNILQFIKNPSEYPGNPDGPKKIFESNLNKLLFKHKEEIQKNDLALNFVYNTILNQITKKGDKNRV